MQLETAEQKLIMALVIQLAFWIGLALTAIFETRHWRRRAKQAEAELEAIRNNNNGEGKIP